MKSSSFEVRLSSKKVDLHAVFHHSGVGPGLVEVRTDSIGTVAANHNASHTALIEGFGHLSKVVFGMVWVRINNDDFPDVLFPNLINGGQQGRGLSRNWRRWCAARACESPQQGHQ